MRMVSGKARKAGVESAANGSSLPTRKEFYTEVLSRWELDGSLLLDAEFLRPAGKKWSGSSNAEPVVASTRKPGDAKAKHTYQYAPESVVATFLTTTYFSHDWIGGRRASTAPPVEK